MKTKYLSKEVEQIKELITEKQSEIITYRKPYHRQPAFSDAISWLVMKEKQSRENDDLIRGIIKCARSQKKTPEHAEVFQKTIDANICALSKKMRIEENGN